MTRDAFIFLLPIILTICIYTEPITKSHTMGKASQECLFLPIFIHIIYLKNTDFVVFQETSNHDLISIFSHSSSALYPSHNVFALDQIPHSTNPGSTPTYTHARAHTHTRTHAHHAGKSHWTIRFCCSLFVSNM